MKNIQPFPPQKINQMTKQNKTAHSFPVEEKSLFLFSCKNLEAQLSHWRIRWAAKISVLIFLMYLQNTRFNPQIILAALLREEWFQISICLGSQIIELELSYCNNFFNLFNPALELRSAVKLLNLNCLDSENISSSWNKTVLKTSNLIQIDYITN